MISILIGNHFGYHLVSLHTFLWPLKKEDLMLFLPFVLIIGTYIITFVIMWKKKQSLDEWQK